MVAPGSRAPSQCSIRSSDRKRFSVRHVKTMSSHQRAAGTAVEEQALVVGSPAAHRDRNRLATVGAGGLDFAVDVKRSADSERIPGAVREGSGVVERTVYPDIPVRVEYALTPLGWQLTELLMSLYEWSVAHDEDLAAA
jgi:hypothetical protein